MQNQQIQYNSNEDKNMNSEQNTSVNKEKQKGNHIAYKILLGAIGLTIIILGIIDLVLFLTPKQNDTSISQDNTSTSQNETSEIDNVFDIDFSELTKEQTITAFKAMNQPGYMPNNYADSALALKGSESYITLDYSYESVEEINTIDYHVSNFGKNEIITTPVGDYYLIVSTDDYKSESSSTYWPKAVSFNKKYVDYYKETTGNSINDRIVFKDTSSPVVRITLPVFALTNTMTQLDSIFSYDFTENENNYTLTLNCIGTSIDTEAYMEMFSADNQPTKATDIPYVITHYTATLNLDKKTGKPKWDRQNGSSISNLKKTFRLNEQEIDELSEYLQ